MQVTGYWIRIHITIMIILYPAYPSLLPLAPVQEDLSKNISHASWHTWSSSPIQSTFLAPPPSSRRSPRCSHLLLILQCVAASCKLQDAGLREAGRHCRKYTIWEALLSNCGKLFPRLRLRERIFPYTSLHLYGAVSRGDPDKASRARATRKGWRG